MLNDTSRARPFFKTDAMFCVMESPGIGHVTNVSIELVSGDRVVVVR